MNKLRSCTPIIVKSSFEDDVLTYETKNTVYVCPLKYMSVHPFSDMVPDAILKMTHQGDDSDDILDKLVLVRRKKRTKEPL